MGIDSRMFKQINSLLVNNNETIYFMVWYTFNKSDVFQIMYSKSLPINALGSYFFLTANQMQF